MSSFNFHQGIREDVGNMISEVGTPCLIQVPEVVIDSYGNHVDTNWVEYTESLWIRQLGEVIQVENIGQMNREDVRFEAGYETKIIPETKIKFKGKNYQVVSIDHPNESNNYTHLVGFAKRELS